MIKRGKQDPLDKPKGVNYLVGHDQNSADTKRRITMQQPQISTDVYSVLTDIASTLNVTVDKIWGVLVHQAQLEWVDAIVPFFISIVMAGIAYIILKRAKGANYDNAEALMGISALTIFIGLVLFVVFVVEISEGVRGLVHPEYWALNEILSLLGK